MKKILLTLLISAMAFSNSVYSDETDLQDKYYLNDPILGKLIYGGYRFYDLSGSKRAEEYEYLHNSATLGGEARLTSLPHRLHFDIDLKNRKDFIGDTTYAYKDKIFLRSLSTSLFHNLSNIRLVDLDTSTPSPGVSVRDSGEEYGTTTNSNHIVLKAKPIEFPFYIYLDGKIIDKEGTKQQMQLLGSGYFNDLVRASQKRDVNWQTKKFTIGAKSHLGPLEVDVLHTEKRFHDKGNKVMTDTYSPAGFFPAASVRIGGIFPHNLNPDIKSSTNTLKLHTSYTGRIVASATFSKTERENQDSGANADMFFGAGNVTWVPTTKLSFFLQYKYKDNDIDNPETVNISDVCSPSNNSAADYTCSIKPSISSATNDFSGIVSYRPFSKLTLKAKYAFYDIRRSHADQWGLPDSTQSDLVSLSSDIWVAKGLKLKAKYTHKSINDPAYNTDPDHSDEGGLSVSWLPHIRVNTLFSYTVTNEERNNIHFTDANGNAISEADGRDVKKDNFLGSITFLLLDDLSVTASHAYIHNRTIQDIAYSLVSGIPMIDSGIPHKNTARNYAIDISYVPEDNFNLNAGVSHTSSCGRFSLNDPNMTQPVSVSSFSDLKVRETIFSISGEYKFVNGFSSSTQYRYSKFNDVLDSPYDDIEDGKSHIISLLVTKNW